MGTIILDSSLFKKVLSQDAVNFICSDTLCIPSTFFSDLEGYTMFLDSKTKEIMNQNVKTVLYTAARNGNLSDAQSANNTGDTYQLALKYSKLASSNCVVTADVTLIERIKLNKLNINIYDLNKEKMISHHQFFIRPSRNTDNTPYDYRNTNAIKEGVQLKDDSGNTYTLSENIHSGGEGKLFKVESKPDKVAKIYLSYPSSARITHLKKLVDFSKKVKIDWCIFPETVLYFNGEAVGFLMQNRPFKAMSKMTLYQGNDHINPDERKKPKSYNYMLSSTFLAQLKFLSAYGLSVCDYGKSNFSQFTAKTPIIFVDTDSFLYKDYSELALDDTAFSKKYTTAKEDIYQLCDEGAYKHVFKIFTLGLDPNCWEYGYVFDIADHPHLYRRAYLSSRLYNHFYSVFSKQGYKSLSSLLKITADEFKDLAQNSKNDISIGEMVDRVLHGTTQNSAPADVPKTTNTTVHTPKNNNTVVRVHDTIIDDKKKAVFDDGMFIDVNLKKESQKKPKSNKAYWWIGIAAAASAVTLFLGMFTDVFSSL